MGEYTEDSTNVLYHILDEFLLFINSVIFFHVFHDKGMKNVALDTLYIHSRSLSDFFSNMKNNSNDLICKDLIDKDIKFIGLSKQSRKYINIVTAHISKKRCGTKLDNNVFFDDMKNILTAIDSFVDCLDDSINIEYRACLEDDDVVSIREIINYRLQVAVLCLVSG